MKFLQVYLTVFIIGLLTAVSSCSTDDPTEIQNSPPQIGDQSFNVSEAATDTEIFGTVTATDPDGDKLSFNLSSDNDNLFKINSDGQLSLLAGKSLDFETTNNYKVLVEVTDGKLNATADISINVIDIDENVAPAITEQSFTVSENIDDATAIGTVVATDSDGDNLTFSISNDASGLFEITTEGEISLAGGKKLDFETAESHLITVQVADESLSSTATVKINVTDVMETQIDNFTPTSTSVGTEVVITGKGFSSLSGENLVTVAGAAAEVIAASETELTIVVPQAASSGVIAVETDNGTGTKGTFILSVANIVQISTGIAHTMVIKDDNTLWGFGDNQYSQLADGTTTDLLTPTYIMSNVKQVAAGSGVTFILKSDNTLWGIGANYNKVLGDIGDVVTTLTQIDSDVVKVYSGGKVLLYTKTDNTLYGMGINSSGQLGLGEDLIISTPTSIMTNVEKVACGSNHTLFLKTDNTLWVAGDNYFGQLGTGQRDLTLETRTHSAPEQIDTNVIDIAAGSLHSAWIKSDNSLWTVGYNHKGQIGQGSTHATGVPSQVASSIMAVSAYGYSTIAIQQNGSLSGAGANNQGQLSLSETVNVTEFTPINISGTAKNLNMGDAYTILTKSDETIWVTGNNSDGQCGLGQTSGVDTFTSIEIE